MENFMRKWIGPLLCLLWMAIIFWFSSQTYHQQDLRPQLSSWLPQETVERNFSWVHFRYSHEEISIRHLGVPGFVEFFIRKGAHFSIYAGLGALLVWTFREMGLTRKRMYGFALAVCVLYAATDEVHQWFTGDRTPLPQDVLIDGAGALFGILAMGWLLRKRFARRYNLPPDL